MTVHQTAITLRPMPRGCHLVTHLIENAVAEIALGVTGVANLFLQHTSASLTINENVSPDVRDDLESIMDHLVPDNPSSYRHTSEGPDDMPAHAKSSLFGASLTIPVTRGRLALGTWQGVYLCEHRSQSSSRTVVITVLGAET
jgi:secondary thiamine-phosphate synthase enzyme